MRMKKLTRPKKPRRDVSDRTLIVASSCALGVVMLIGAAASGSRPDKMRASVPTAAPVRTASSSTPAASLPAETANPAPAAAETTLAVDVKAPAPKAAPVTITGCLEKDDQTFRLKDTDGADSPKSRSWKSGFLKKTNAAVHVVDASNRLKLPAYVGQRVSVTGTVVEREMQARSVKRVAASCGVKS